MTNPVAIEFADEILQYLKPPPYGKPWIVPLILLTYINEEVKCSLSGNPYVHPHGAEIPVTLEERYNYIIDDIPSKPINTFYQALNELDNRIIHSTESFIFSTDVLSFRHPSYFEGVKLSLDNQIIKNTFVKILTVLGRYIECKNCHKKVFMSPIIEFTNPYSYSDFDIDSDACPKCGHINKGHIILCGHSYGVFNEIFVSNGLIQKFHIRIGETHTVLQFLTHFLENQYIKNIKEIIQTDIFEHCKVPITINDFDLYVSNEKLNPNEKLSNIYVKELELKLNSKSKLDLEAICKIMKEEIATWEM